MLSVTLVYCGQTVGRIKIKPGMQVGLGPGHIVLDGVPAPRHPKGHSPPNLWPISVAAKWLHGSRCHLYGSRPWSRRLCVRWEPGSHLPKKRGGGPKFVADVYCGQTAGWIKIRLRMKVDISPGDLVVLDGDPAPLAKGGGQPPPQFSTHFYCGQTARCVKMPLSMDVGLSPGTLY